MPRNSSGVYSLPTGNPVIAGTTIEADWANTTMDDVGAALTGSLPRDGSAPMTGDLVLNGLTPTNPNAAISKSYCDNFIGMSSGFPLGFIAPFAGDAVPGGFLLCNGQAVSRTTYAALFAIIGVSYGVGDGSTTFNVPNLIGYFIRGRDPSKRAVGSTQAGQIQAHSHPVSDPGHSHTIDQYSGPATPGYSVEQLTSGLKWAGGGINSNTTGITVGSTGGTETVPQNIAFDYYIKAVIDAGGPTVVASIASSDAQMIAIDDTTPSAPILDIQANVAYGVPKLGADGRIGLDQMPTGSQTNLGPFDASVGDNPSEAFPAVTFNDGDVFIVSVAGSISLIDLATQLPALTAVDVSDTLIYVKDSPVNVDGWYLVEHPVSPVVTATEVSFSPYGSISATNVQAAIQELVDEGALNAASSPTITGSWTFSGALIASIAPSFNAGLNMAGTLTQTNYGATNSVIQMFSETGVNYITQSRYADDVSGSEQQFRKYRGSIATPANVQASDYLGITKYWGYNGSLVEGASINARVDGAPGAAGTLPGKLVFSTTAPGASSPTERMVINSYGAISVNGDFGTSGQILVSKGNAAPPEWGWGAAFIYPNTSPPATMVAANAGTALVLTAGITIPNATMQAGAVVTLRNSTGSAITITQGSGLSLTKDGAAATGNKTLAAYSMATVWFQSSSIAIISGSGVS